MGEQTNPEALVDGDHDMPTDAEIQAMREEAENFRLPAPAPIPVRGRYYLTECEYCGWVGSSEHCGGNCGPDDDDIVCPVCCSSICGDAPDEADTAKHGEAVYQRIVAAEAERDAALAAHQQVTAERDEYAEALMKVAEVGGWQASAGLAAEVRSALARLRAEGEAKDRARDDALLALKVYVESGHGGAMCEVREWLRAGAQGPVPFYDGALFRMWAEANGIVSRDGFLARAATAREG